VHGLVTGGGLTPDGQWKAVRQGFLLPARGVMAVFRGKMLEAIRQADAREALVLPEGMRPQPFLNLLGLLGHPCKTPWNVRIMERYRHGAGVMTYLARYLRGGPLKNARLVAYDGACVTFTYRARQEEADGATPVAQQCLSAGRDAVWGAQRAWSADDWPAGEAVRACGRREGVGVTQHNLHSASEHPVSGRIRTRSVQTKCSPKCSGPGVRPPRGSLP
jgi:putative transposase